MVVQQEEERHAIHGNVVAHNGSSYLTSHSFERTNVDAQQFLNNSGSILLVATDLNHSGSKCSCRTSIDWSYRGFHLLIEHFPEQAAIKRQVKRIALSAPFYFVFA